MHNPTLYRATFSGLIMTAFGKEQTLKYRAEIEMYQARDCPEVWRTRPAMETGRHKWEASTPADLAKILQSDFVTRETAWTEHRSSAPRVPRPKPQNVVSIDQRRRA